MAHSPRKVPLSLGDDAIRPRTKSNTFSFTRRAYFCGVVVEGADYGEELSQGACQAHMSRPYHVEVWRSQTTRIHGLNIRVDMRDLIQSLGDRMDLGSEPDPMECHSPPLVDLSPGSRRPAMTDFTGLADIVKELLTTERSYVNRLKMLKDDYADPLRSFARSKDTAVLPLYEAKTLFGNIDHLLPVNQAFLEDLEKMGREGGPGVGDVALKHFKELKGFEHYRKYYSKREEAQMIFEREAKKSSTFAQFLDRVKYSGPDVKNRVGLRELLMEPVQRIPRYTLMFRSMIKLMAIGDPQRQALMEADEIAAQIAAAEADEETKRAQILYCLNSSIEDFPPALFSNSRRFVDCIDVEDVLLDNSGPSAVAAGGAGGSQPGGNLHCSLFLFDDKLMITKRPASGDKGGRELAGLDDPEKTTKAGGILLGSKKKTGMSYKGVVDVVEVAVADVGGADIHMFLERPPRDQSDRWSGRPFRALTVTLPANPNADTVALQEDKARFLQNFWDVQARYRTKLNQSVVLRSSDFEVENRGSKITNAITYFNVYTRIGYLEEAKKPKVVLHLDPSGTADPIPLAIRSSPLVAVRVQPLEGELCRYKVTTSDPGIEEDEDIVQTNRLPERVVHTIHQYGLFNFSTGRASLPPTPSTTRSRANIFGLDAISRNIFKSDRPKSVMGESFMGSAVGHRRSKTSYAGSRTSTYTEASSANDDNISRFSRANSTTTAATSLDDSSIGSNGGRSRSLPRGGRRLVKRKQPRLNGSDSEGSPPKRNSIASLPVAGPSGMAADDEYDSGREFGAAPRAHRGMNLDPSERDLALRLELARRNGESQRDQQYPPLLMDTDYGRERTSMRPHSRASKELPPAPVEELSDEDPPDTHPTAGPSYRDRSNSGHSVDLRPMGPRAISPLSSIRGAQVLSVQPIPSELAMGTPLMNLPSTTALSRRTPIPRSRLQQFSRTGSLDETPRPPSTDTLRTPGSVEPLAIRKKASIRTNASTSSSGSWKRAFTSVTHSAPGGGSRSPSRSPRGEPSGLPMEKELVAENMARMIRLVETTKEDIESSRRAVKRIKLESEKLRTLTPATPATPTTEEPADRPTSPPRTPGRLMPRPPPAQPLTREAQARMEEMQRLIGKRNINPLLESSQRSRTGSVAGVGSPPSPRIVDPPPRLKEATRVLDDLVDQVDAGLDKALKGQETLQGELQGLTTGFEEQYVQYEQMSEELRSANRQCVVLKSLLNDTHKEQSRMYKAFNEELDHIFNDLGLPEDEARTALAMQLRAAKEEKNELLAENARLKWRLQDTEMRKDEWGAILRSHGLIS
ncbi:RhoGEF-domain-containing protein [Laetiporus sulphureus 93-53]|uniref:RhoGEF-domain-containing protein n=1 Tax=Laetiporus sulphureus 93-53 TaxID=1314785 RepID=A0A165DTH8_9APHY|nr:RhoGEF-domain-containing protein [Laetiporus sulphureus 93-53]KZT05600.1 RhoGEF-domain-containing protein [Laetiporus sulphureus 93-53]